MSDEKSRLVYSTDHSVQQKEKPDDKVFPSGLLAVQQRVTVRLDRKSRGGKSVTVIEGLLMPQKEVETLLRKLKAKLGTGGTVKESTLEIQGDHRDTLMKYLEKMGYRPKRSGG